MGLTLEREEAPTEVGAGLLSSRRPVGGRGRLSMGKRRLRLFVAAQVGVPAFVLAWRLIDAPVPFYGWGWEMFS